MVSNKQLVYKTIESRLNLGMVYSKNNHVPVAFMKFIEVSYFELHFNKSWLARLHFFINLTIRNPVSEPMYPATSHGGMNICHQLIYSLDSENIETPQ